MGLSKIEFEDSAIYLNENDQEHFNYKNGLWLNFEKKQHSNFLMLLGVVR